MNGPIWLQLTAHAPERCAGLARRIRDQRDRKHKTAGMLAAPYVDAVGRMDRRFVTTSVVPTVVFLTGYGAVAIPSLWSFDAASTWLSGRSATELVLLGLAASALTWFLAGLMASNWRKIVRLYEGYPLHRWLARGRRRRALDRYRIPGFAFHLEQKNRLARTNAGQFYFRYPLEHDKDTLPTTIGNILLAGERYGVDRYGFETNLLWTRFAWCLPDKTLQSLEQFKEEHQLPLALSFTAATFAIASGITVLLAGGSPSVFVISTVVGVALSVAAYLLSIERTEEYAEQLRATIDLHHPKLREAWEVKIPDGDMEDWFADARAFIEGGHEGMQQQRKHRPARVVRPPSGATVQSPEASGSADVAPAADAGTAGGRIAAPLRAFEWILGRVRLLWMVVGIAAVLVGLGAWRLSVRSVTVVIAAADAKPGEPVRFRTAAMRSQGVPKDAVTTVPADAIAARALHEGDVLVASSVRSAKALTTLTLPLSGTTKVDVPANIDALIVPCGLLLRDVTASPEPAAPVPSVTLLLADAQVAKLSGCAPSAVNVLKKAGQP